MRVAARRSIGTAPAWAPPPLSCQLYSCSSMPIRLTVSRADHRPECLTVCQRPPARLDPHQCPPWRKTPNRFGSPASFPIWTTSMAFLDLDAFLRAPMATEPFQYTVAHGFIRPEQAQAAR